MRCSYCGRKNEEAAASCAECGTPLTEPVGGSEKVWTIVFARAYSWALCVSLVIQAACLALCATRFLEFTARMFFLAFGFYWLGFLAVVLPRPRSLSAWRLFYVAFGFLAWFDAAVLLVPSIYGDAG